MNNEFMVFFGPAMWYFANHCVKESCHNGSLSGQRWLNEVLLGNPRRCRSVFRMHPPTFRAVCDRLKADKLLHSTKNVSAEEKLATFLYIVGHGCSNRQAQERFQRSGWTITQ